MSEPHSAAYFGDQRNFWWNPDFLALMAKRLDLPRFRKVLDAGCGVGHWGRALLPHLPDVELVGVDREPLWVAEATRRAPDGRASYRQADVGALPFPDASFDLVTCQTVLIHVRDVRLVLRELLRVLRPGGLLLVAEPNNLANALCIGSRRGASLVESLDLLRLQAICERGKIALGEGDNSVGDLLPGMFAEEGLRDVRCWANDRTAMLVPPYDAPDQRAFRDDLLEFDEKELGIWSRAETERYFLAGGGAAGEFEPLWERARARARGDAAALRHETFHQAGGGVFYLVAGTRA